MTKTMKKKLFLLLTVFVAAGGSGQGPRPETVFEYGEWETRTELISLDAPSLPDSAQQSLRQTLEGANARACMGGASSNPARDLRDGFVQGVRAMIGDAACSFSGRDILGNGAIGTQGSCRSAALGTEMSFVINGSYDETSVGADFAMAARRLGSSEQEALIRMQGRTTVRRVGPCRAGAG